MDCEVLLEQDGDLLQVWVGGYVVLDQVAALQSQMSLVDLETGRGGLRELGKLASYA
jgi:hypothetical protein